jgi:hypothetical protein
MQVAVSYLFTLAIMFLSIVIRLNRDSSNLLFEESLYKERYSYFLFFSLSGCDDGDDNG